MAENATEVATSAPFEVGTGGHSVTRPSIIKGWNDKRKTNNQILSSMIPFVQLIGIFDEKEYEKMFKLGKDRFTNITFDDGTGKSDEYDQRYPIDPKITFDEIKRQIGERFFNLYLVSSVDHGMNVQPVNGIMMAERTSQATDASGGIGITDLQVEYGKGNVTGGRKFNIRMTINDPKILDERVEYSKLAAFGGSFLIIYGWSNPEVIPGYDAVMSPPKLEGDPRTSINGSPPTRQRLIVPLKDLGNGGYWSAGQVNVSKYDFGFNEMGKMEINVTLRDDATNAIASTTMSSLAKKFRLFLTTGELDRMIVTSSGNEFSYREALHDRQMQLTNDYLKIENPTQADHAEYISKWDEAIEELGDAMNVNVLGETVEQVSPPENPSYLTEDDIRQIKEEVTKPQKGYPESNALYTYKQIYATVLDTDPESPGQIDSSQHDQDEADKNGTVTSMAPTKQVISYEKKAAYYFLGAIMDSVSLSMATTTAGIGSSKVPSFFYRDISNDSKLSTAFNSKLKSVNRASGMEDRIQEAVIRLKERFLPPPPVDWPHAWKHEYDDLDELNRLFSQYNLSTDDYRKDQGGPRLWKTTVTSARAIYEGNQSRTKDRVIEAIFPPPPKVGNMVGVPMRGFKVRVNTNEYNKMLRDKGLEGFGEVWVFIPDWKQEIAFDAEGNEVKSSGHPDGFDPLNPTEYRAALPRPGRGAGFGREPSSKNFEERSQDPYGRGGRFMIAIEIPKWQGQPAKRVVVPYDVWRQSSRETWNLLQKTWNNIYREYLAAYFERVIRLRINQIEPVGIPVEAIFNEPLDLDWMSGRVYRNGNWSGRRHPSKWIHPYSFVAGYFAEGMDLGTETAKIEQEAKVYEKIIAEKTIEIEGEIAEPAGEEYTTETPLPSGGLRKASADIVDDINKLKRRIEELTGGKYQTTRDGQVTTQDVLGNIIMLRFKNFLKVVPSDEVEEEVKEPAFDPVTLLPISVRIRTLKPEIEYERASTAPTVNAAWILWNKFGVPTNNYQNRWNIEKNDWEDSLNKTETWKENNFQAYEKEVLPKVDENQQEVYEKLNSIDSLQDQLNPLYEEYEEARVAINNAERKINEGKRSLVEFEQFLNDEGKVELSPYDDTSDFDGDGIKVPVGRAEPMHLTTRVAQQWYRRFSYSAMNGVMDVANYGPPQGGRPYNLPTNTYEFTFDFDRRQHGVMGTPQRVLDPEFLLTMQPSRRKTGSRARRNWQRAIASLLKDLSYGLKTSDATTQVISRDLPYAETVVDYGTRKSYQNWSLFGTPGIPNEGGNNEWGFRYGPPFERTLGDDTIEQLGGNYVRTYKDFLNLFQMGYNPDWPDPLRVIGKWPMPYDTDKEISKISSMSSNSDFQNELKNLDDGRMLAQESSIDLPIYTLIDGLGNILVDDGNGWYKPSGWLLEFSGKPVMLYPSRETACKINNSNDHKNGVRPDGVLTMGGLSHVGHNGDRQRIGAGWSAGHHAKIQSDDNYSGRTKKLAQKVQDYIAEVAKQWWASMSALLSGDLEGYFKEMYKFYKKLAPMAFGAVGFGLFLALRNNAVKYLNDGYMTDYLGNKATDKGGPWGGRIGEGEHCLNLTLPMKQAMIYHRPNLEDKTSFLGKDMGGGGGTGQPANMQVDWNQIIKIGEYYVYKNDNSKYAEYERYEYVGEGKYSKLVPKGSVIGPKTNNQRPYSNPEYPYGTGWYEARSKQHGPYVFPEKSKNWVDWGDLLIGLPGYGFMTQIDNNNYSSCMVQPNGKITDGLEMNTGFVKFIVENVFAPLPKNRRTMARDNHKPIKILGSNEGDELGGYHESERLHDTTYADLFGPLQDDSEDDEANEPAEASLSPTNFGNIDNFVISNVKNIPIRREVVDNLVNKNNRRMSVGQFFGEIFRPGAIGVNSGGNQNLAMRQAHDGTFEIFAASSVNWQKMVNQYAHLWGAPLNDVDAVRKRFPEDVIMLDFKAGDSLIESMDMNSTFDPLVGKAMRDAAEDFTGSKDALINLLSYKEIAVDLQQFLETDPEFAKFSKDADGQKAIEFGTDGQPILNRKLLLREDGIGANDVVVNAITRFLESNQRKLNALRALQQAAQAGQTDAAGDVTRVDNFATQLMSNYMKKTTITIHGTTGISPHQKIIVKGIMPNLEGMYRITAVRESLSPQGFQTIIEGALVGTPSENALDAAIASNRFNPVEADQPNATPIQAPKKSVEEVLSDTDQGDMHNQSTRSS